MLSELLAVMGSHHRLLNSRHLNSTPSSVRPASPCLFLLLAAPISIWDHLYQNDSVWDRMCLILENSQLVLRAALQLLCVF